VMAVTFCLLILSDFRFHWQRRRLFLGGLGLGALLALPYLRFVLVHPGANLEQLTLLESYWLKNIPLMDKMGQFLSRYTAGLSPVYWYRPNDQDLARHLMKNYGNILWQTFPFLVLGLIQVLRNIRQSRFRTILAALLAVPVGAALVEVGITRLMALVMPAALLSALGLINAIQWLKTGIRKAFVHILHFKKAPQSVHAYLVILVFTVLSGVNFYMLWDSLANGPRWYDDYGMAGMQYGATQVFPEIRAELVRAPQEKIFLSPIWTNGADILARFFFPDPVPFELASIDGFLNSHQPIDENTLLVMTPKDYLQAVASAKFQELRIEKTLQYPNGMPGFFFLRVKYVDQIDAILAAEKEARKVLGEEEVLIDGQTARVSYSYLDMGSMMNIFDGDLNTVIRTFEANPLRIEVDFSHPRRLSGVSLKVGGVSSRVTAEIESAPNSDRRIFYRTVSSNPDPRVVDLNFGSVIVTQRVFLEIFNVDDPEPTHVHLWEVTFR
jgi:hypothetical protein